MALQLINTGASGESPSSAFTKVKAMFLEIYTAFLGTLTANKLAIANGSGNLEFRALVDADLPDTTTNTTTFTNCTIALEGIGEFASLDLVAKQFLYPIGIVYTSTTSTNPATLLGFGTWAAFGTGRCLVGLDSGQTEFDALSETGGAKTVTLGVTQIPSHSHTQTDYTISTGRAAGYYGANGYENHTTDAAGGGGAHNNLMPYIVVYFWNRTA
jgi:hypothetical protein